MLNSLITKGEDDNEIRIVAIEYMNNRLYYDYDNNPLSVND